MSTLPELIAENRELREKMTDMMTAGAYGNLPGWVILWPVLEIATLAYDIIEKCELRDSFAEGEADKYREAIAEIVGISAQ